MKKLALLFALVLALSALTVPAFAEEEYSWKPTQQIELVVPFGAGGSSDLSARALVPYLEKELGCSIFVNNVSGAGGLTGTMYALNKKPDGYTLMWEGTRSTSPEVYQLEAPYKTEDMVAIAELTETYSVLVVPADSQFNSYEELVEYAQQNPGLKYAHTGRGYKNHITALTIDSTYNLGMIEVPYSGDTDACTAVVRGDVDWGVISLTTGYAQFEGGNLKILAVCNSNRNEKIPDVPTLGETKYPVEDIVSYIGLFASKDTPAEIVETYSKAVGKCAENESLKADLASINQSLVYRDSTAFAELITSLNSVIAPVWEGAGLLE